MTDRRPVLFNNLNFLLRFSEKGSMDRGVRSFTMIFRPHLALVLLTGSLLSQGCVGEDSFHSIAHSGEENHFGSVSEWDASGELGDYVQPVIDEFMAEPLYLPLGGGDVELSWSTRQASQCSLRIDDRVHVVGQDGVAIVSVEADTELELLCIDNEDNFDSAIHAVTVQTPPTDEFDDDATALHSPEYVKTSTTAKFGDSPVAERRVSINQLSRVTLTPATDSARSSVTLWLAQDINRDGWVDDDEIIATARSGSQQKIQVELPQGKYTLFIESDGQAAEWTVESYIVPFD
jgi:hypothetical protein